MEPRNAGSTNGQRYECPPYMQDKHHFSFLYVPAVSAEAEAEASS